MFKIKYENIIQCNFFNIFVIYKTLAMRLKAMLTLFVATTANLIY